MKSVVYTIGHSRHPIEKLLDLLSIHDVTEVADVRSSPYSRRNSQFNRDPLRARLERVGISYIFLGHELGARSEDPACYVDGKVQYEQVANTEVFRQGLDRLEQEMNSHRLAMLCAEKDPLTCHRTILVSRHLVARGIVVQHILEDGRLESHGDAMTRLLSELGCAEWELFRSPEDVLAEAYARRGDQIAYTEKEHDEDSARRALG